MPNPLQLASVFSAGMKRDFDRAQMPGGSAWNLVDYIPDELGAPLRGRGAWPYIGGAMTSVTAVKAMVYAPFSGGAKTLGVGQNGELWEVSAVTDIGAVNVPAQNPFFYRDKVIVTNNDGTTTVKKYPGSGSPAALGGTPPTAKYGGVFKDHAFLANTSTHTSYVYFSDAGDPETWDTTNGFIPTSSEITAVAALKSLILVMHKDSIERLRGTTPPPGTDMILEGFMDVGCLDAFSVATWNDQVVFASAEGVYITDGASWVNLTDVGGMRTYWQSMMQSYSGTYKLSGGVYQGHYILSVTDSTSFVDCLVCDLRRRAWWRFSNFPGSSFASTVAGQEELYMGLASAGRVAKVSPCWNLPASPVTQSDASGTGPRTVLETAYFRGWTRLHRRWIPSLGLQIWKWLFVNYDIRDGGSTPTLTVSYTKSPQPGASYTAITGNLAATTAYLPPTGRVKRALSFRGQGIAVKVAQNNAAADNYLYALEADYQPVGVGQLG
jgi:hypothetical protein